MVAVVNGSGLGLHGSLLPTRSDVGSSNQGQSPEQIFINSATGNLVIQDRDEALSALGLDLPLVRTYNSQGLMSDDNGDNWRLGVYQRVFGLTGTRNTAGSTITKEFGDGDQVVYTYNTSRSLYVSSDGEGAYDTLSYDSSTSQWTWTDGSTRNTETYNSSGQLLNSKDVDGNTTSYSYTGSLLTQITDASGQVTHLDYTGNNLTQIRVTKSGQPTQTLTRYGYDTQGRLSTVTVDLSPSDSSITDGKTYVTTYTYEGTSTRVASITQGDGTTVSFTYVLQDSSYRLETYTDGDGKVTTFDYSSVSGGGGGSGGSVTAPANSGVLSTTEQQTTSTTYGLDDEELTGTAGAQTYNLDSGALTLGGTTNVLHNFVKENVTVPEGEWVYYTIDVPEDMGQLFVNLQATAGSTGDAMLYAARGSLPTFDNYDRMSDRDFSDNYNNENVSITFPQPGTWYIGIYAYTAIQGAELQASFQPDTDEVQTLTSGKVVTDINGMDGEFREFTFDIAPGTSSLQLALSGTEEDGDLYLSYGAPVDRDSLETADYKSDGDTVDETINISSPTAGTWYVLAKLWSYVTDAKLSLLTNLGTNTSPHVEAGPAQQANSGATVNLSASGGDAESGVTYQWTQIEGPSVTLSSTNSASVSFTAPNPSSAAQLSFRVTVTDAQGATDSDVVHVTVTPPVLGYTVPTGATWQSVANDLYGSDSADLADELQAALLYPSLVPGTRLVGLPESLVVGPSELQNFEVRPNIGLSDNELVYYTIDVPEGMSSLYVSLDAMPGAGGDAGIALNYGSPPTEESFVTYSDNDYDGNYLNEACSVTNPTAGTWYIAIFAFDAVHDARLRVAYQTDTDQTQTLTPGQAVSDINCAAGDSRQFAFEIAPGTDDLDLTLSGLAGSGDLYLSYGAPVDTENPDYYYGGSPNASIHVDEPTAGTWYALVNAYTYFDDAKLILHTDIGENTPPEVDAGPAQYIGTGATVNLSASGSDEESGVTYQWTQIDGPSVTLSSTSNAAVSFTAPNVATELSFRVTVTDADGAKDSDVVHVFVSGSALGYTIPAGATWQSIANTLYGVNSAAAGAALQTALGNPPLTEGNRLTSLPSALSLSSTTNVTVPAYYVVQSGNTWATITQAIYGTSDANAIAALQSATGNPPLTTGLHLTVPLSLTYTSGTSGSGSGTTVYLRTDVTDATGQVTSYLHDTSGQLSSVLSPAVGGTTQLTTSFTYDSDGNILTITQDPAGLNRVTTMAYDTNGNMLSSRDADGNTVTRTYDSANQLVTETHYLVADPDGAESGQASSPITTRYAYDSEQHLRFVVSADGRVTEYRYNTAGQRTTTIKYDGAVDNVSALTPTTTLSESTLTAWAASQDLTKIERTEFAYDFRGNVSTATAYAVTTSVGAGVSGTSSVTQYVYDQRGLLLQKIDPRGSTTAADPANANIPYATTYTYDGLGRITNSTQWAASTGGSNPTSTTVYDAVNNSIITTLANGLVTTSVYDEAGHLVSVSNSGPGIIGSSTTRYAYDADGRLRMTTDPDDVRTYVVYDEAGRKVGDIDGTGAVTHYVYNNANQVVKTIRYAKALGASALATLVDAQGNPADVSLATLVDDSLGLDQITRNVYDAAGLKLYSIDEAGDLTKYLYDAAGRLTDKIQYATRVTVAAAVDQLLPGHITPTVDTAHDRRERYFYDNDGNLRGVLNAEGYLTEYTYDAGGHLTRTMSYATQSPSAQLATGSLANLIPTLDDETVVTAAEDATTYFYYDGQGRKIGEFERALVNGKGYLTETQYDAAGNVQTVIRYDRELTYTVGTSTFATLKSAASAAGAKPQTTLYQYDGAGRLIQETNYEGTVTVHSYNGVGNEISQTVASGQNDVPNDTRTTQRRYDALGRVTQELSARGSTLITGGMSQSQINEIWDRYGTTYEYDAAGRRISATTQPYDQIANTSQTNTTYYYYDDDGRLRFTVDASGAVAETRYNALGEVTDQRTYVLPLTPAQLLTLTGGLLTDPVNTTLTSGALDRHSTYTYKPTGLLESSTTAEGGYITHAYDAFGNETTRTEKIDSTRTLTHNYQYDRLGHQTFVQWDPTGVNSTRTVAYDAFGRVQSITDQYGNKTTTHYDRVGRAIETIDALNNKRTTFYDAFSRILSTTDAYQTPQNTTLYSYDDATRTVVVTTPEGISVTTVHNRNGQTLTVTTKGPDNVTVNSTSYSYDLNGNLSDTSDSLGALEHRVYDSNGRELTTTDGRGIVTRFTYDAVNRVLTRTVDDGGLALVTSYEYNTSGQVTQITEPGNRVTATAYDHDGRVSTVTVDPRSASNPTGLNLVTKYTYDDAGNEITVTEGYGSFNPRVTQYTYDVLRRRTEEVLDPGAGTNPVTGRAYLNLTTAYKYDRNGNLTRKIDANGNSTWYVYDADSRLTYTVNALGEVTQTRYDVNGLVASTTRYITNVSTTGFGDVVTAVTVASVPTSDEFIQSIYDRDGREHFTIDAVGVVTERTFDPAGNVTRTRIYAKGVAPGTYTTVATVTTALTTAGNDVNAISTDDRVSWSAYDSRNRELFSVKGTGAVVSYLFDASGNISASTAYATQRSITLAMGLVSLQVWAAQSSIATNADNRTTRYWYDGAGRAVFQLDAEGYLHETRYNDAQRSSSTILYASKPTIAANAITADVAQNSVVTGFDASRDHVSTSDRDAAGRVIRVYDALTLAAATVWEEYGYDAVGNLISVVDPRGIELAYGNTAWAQSMRDGLHYNTDAAALVNVERDVLKALYTTVHAFDAAGREISVTDPLHNITKKEYDGLGRVVKITDPRNNVGYTYYDAAGRVRYQIDPSGYATEQVYDALDNLTDEIGYANPITEAYSQATTLAQLAILIAPHLDSLNDRRRSRTYDQRGLVKAITYYSTAANYTESFEYDSFGDKSGYTDRNQASFEYHYDANGHLTLERDPQVQIVGESQPIRLQTEYEYNAFGELSYKREAFGRVDDQRDTHHVYDHMGRETRVESPAFMVFDPVAKTNSLWTPTVQKYYDAAGNLTREIAADGGQTINYYDTRNLLIASVNADNALSEYEYDAVGNLVREREYDMRVTGVPDPSVRPTAVSPTKYRELTHVYSANNLKVQTQTLKERLFSYGLLVQPDRNAVSGYYDAPVTTLADYDANGNVVRTTDGNNYHTYQYYDAKGNHVLQVDAEGYVTQWAYNAQGQVTTETKYAGQLSDPFKDALSTTTAVSTILAAIPPDSADDRVTEYDYDQLGRLKTERKLAVAYWAVDDQTGVLSPNAITDDLETRYEYDGNGNRTALIKANDERTDYHYDSLGRMDQQRDPQFVAFGSSQPVRSQTNFQYDALGNLTIQTQLGTTVAENRETRFEYDNAGNLRMQQDAEGAQIFYDYDKAGNVLRSSRDVTDVDGAVHTYRTYHQYDLAGRETHRTDVDDEDTSAELTHETHDTRYNAHGDIEAAGVNGRYQEQYIYDRLGRLFWTNKENGTPRLYVYDANGNAVVELHAIDTDLSRVLDENGVLRPLNGPVDVDLISPTEVQFTLSVYDGRNQLVDVFEPTMEYGELLSTPPQVQTTGSPGYIESIPGIPLPTVSNVPGYQNYGTGGVTSRQVGQSSSDAYYYGSLPPASDPTSSPLLPTSAAEFGLTLGTATSGESTAVNGISDDESADHLTRTVVQQITTTKTTTEITQPDAYHVVERRTTRTVTTMKITVFMRSTTKTYSTTDPRLDTSWDSTPTVTQTSTGQDVVYETTHTRQNTTSAVSSYVGTNSSAQPTGSMAFGESPKISIESWAYDNHGEYYPEYWTDAIMNLVITIPAIAGYGGGDTTVEVSGFGISGTDTRTFSVHGSGSQYIWWDTGMYWSDPGAYRVKISKGGVVVSDGYVYGPAGVNTSIVSDTYLPSIVSIQGQDSSANAARIRFQNPDGSWGGWSDYVAPTTPLAANPEFIFRGNYSAGQAYEYEVNSGATVKHSAYGVLGSPTSEVSQYYTHTTVTALAYDTVTQNGNQPLGGSTPATSGALAHNNYIRNLILSITEGGSESHKIHRSQRYNAFGEIDQQTDGNGNETNYEYDKLGDLIEQIQPLTEVYGSTEKKNPISRNYYDQLGQLVATEDANSTQLTTGRYYNTRVLVNGRIEKEFDPFGNHVTHVYDVLGNERQSFDELGLETDQLFDRNGRLVRVDRYSDTSALYTSDAYGYDEAGNRISHTNGLLNPETDLFDSQNRDIRHTSFEGRNTVYTYAYDESIGGIGGFRKETKTEAPLGAQDVMTDEIDYFGMIRSHEDMGHHLFTYQYNNAGWLKHQGGDTNNADRADQDIAYEYWGNGLVKSISDAGISSYSLFQYDKNGNRTLEAYSQVEINAGLQSKTPYEVLSAQYDELNRVKHVEQQGVYNLNYTYDLVGNRRSMVSTYTNLVELEPERQTQTQAFYYTYDKMNRFTITMGTLDASGSIVIGNTGTHIHYDEAGHRDEVYSDLLDDAGVAHYSHETYTYDPTDTVHDIFAWDINDNRIAHTIRSNNAIGEETDEYDYGVTDDQTVRYMHFAYDRDSLTTLQADETNPLERDLTTYQYDGNGILTSAESRTVDPTGHNVPGHQAATLSYAYEKWDTYKNSVVTITADIADPNGLLSGQSLYKYDSNGHINYVLDSQEDRSIAYVNNQDGVVLRRSQINHESNASDAKQVLRQFYVLNGRPIGDVGTDMVSSRVDYVQSLAALEKNGQKLYPQIGDRVFPVTSADFDQNYQPINLTYPPLAPQSHIVSDGETLQSIALSVWGDSSLWYILADANGLTGSEKLVAGTRLTVPNVVTNFHNNADTFRPYDMSLALGDTTPTLPDPPPPPVASHGGCGVLGTVLIIIVAIVVTIYTAGAASGAASALFSGTTTATAAGTAGAAATGAAATWSAGIAAVSGAAGWTGVAGAVVGGAVGSAVSQGLAIASGMQSGFSWKDVAVAGVGAGVTAGLGVVAKGTSSLATGLQHLQDTNPYQYAALHGAASSALTQGISVATGLQSKFSWRDVAVSAIAEPVATRVGNEAVAFANGGNTEFVQRFASGVGGALVRRAFDDRINVGAAIADAFGSAIVDSAGSTAVEEQRRAERFLDSYNAKNPNLADQLFGDLDDLGADASFDSGNPGLGSLGDENLSLPALYDKYYGVSTVPVAYHPGGDNGTAGLALERVPQGIMTDEARAVADRNMQRVLQTGARDLFDLIAATQTPGMMKRWITGNSDDFAQAFSGDLSVPELAYIGSEVPEGNLVNPTQLSDAQLAQAHERFGVDEEAAYQFANYRNRAAIVNRMTSEVALQGLAGTWDFVRDLNPVLFAYERGYRFATGEDAWTGEPQNPLRAAAEFGLAVFAPAAANVASRGKIAEWLAPFDGSPSGLSTGLAPYKGSMLDDALVGSGLQRHHINESAAFGNAITRDDGLIVPLEGNEIGTPHYNFHQAMRAFWAPYQKGGELEGFFPTNARVGEAQLAGFLHAGYTPAEAKYLAAAARGERLIYGLKDSALVPNIPKKGK